MYKVNELISVNPSTNQVIWKGKETSIGELADIVANAKKVQQEWEKVSIDEKQKIINNFAEYVQAHVDDAAKIISDESGKPFWEAKTEVKSLINKVQVVFDAYTERAKTKEKELVNGRKSYTRYRPYGVMAVLGPFNFPMSMPNSHIMPAIYAGNTVIFKPSERTIKSAEYYVQIWKEAGLPDGVLQIVYGDGKIGEMLIKSSDVEGALFIGSYEAGKSIEKIMAERNRICVLEMGGNSPLVIWDYSDIRAAINIAIQSAYISSGQRCSAARRLIVNRSIYDDYIPALKEAIKGIIVGKPYDEDPEPFMGPMIDKRAVDTFLGDYDELIKKGAKVLVPTSVIDELGVNFVRPALIDVTAIEDIDKEVFGPLLQLVVVDSIEEAVEISNKTQYGLAAGIVTESKEIYEYYYRNTKAGILNWNQQLTGSTTINPFGGIKGSGNFHAAGYLSVDYCAYGCASIESPKANVPKELSPGLYF